MSSILRDITQESGWIMFLSYLAEEEDWKATEIIHVVEKPWKWEKEVDEFIRASMAPEQPDYRQLNAMLNGEGDNDYAAV